MAKLFFTFLIVVASLCAQAQNVGIGTTTPNTNAALDISSNSKGLLIPRTSTASRTAIATPPKGLMVYDTSFSAFYYYDGGRWLPVGDKNYDSATVDYHNVNGTSLNLPTSFGSSVSATGNSGFIYDNGGPAGNYSANNFSSSKINFDDSTLQIKITVEEMNAEAFYDSLFIVQLKGNTYTDTLATFTGTQTGIVTATNDVRIYFKTNNINQFAGFKIRWGRLRNSGALQIPTPLYGWHFNNAKLAAMGGVQRQNNWHKDSLGFGSLSYGIGNKAKGKNSFAVGYNSNAMGDYSIAMGSNTNASGSSSTAMGFGTTASGGPSSAMGYNTIASGQFSTVSGESSTAIGFVSTAMGSQTTASNLFTTAMGHYTTASGSTSTAMGYNTTASGEVSTAMGAGTKAKGAATTVTGLNNIANGFSSLVAGMYNDSLVAEQSSVATTTPLFIVGNGYSDIDRSNAFVVLKNGNVAIGDNGNPVNRLHITGGTSATINSNSGYITTGSINNFNMVIGDYGIQARRNGVTASLYLQPGGGSVCIGGVTSVNYQLEITGTAGKPGGGSWSNASDRRLKENVLPYSDGLQQLLKIKPVKYHYNATSGYDTKPEYVGIIAQDLQTVAPYMVSTLKKADKEYLSVDNSAMTYMLINAVKEQQQQIENQNTIIEKLRLQVEQLLNNINKQQIK